MIDQAAASDLRPLLHRPSRRILWVLVLVFVLLGLCAAGAYFWANPGEFVDTPVARAVASTMGLSPQDRTSLSEIQWAQKASDEIAELGRRIDAQREDIKVVLDQITVLTSRIESLQNLTPVPSAPSVPPSSPAQAVSSPAKKRVGRSKPQGPVSVGGSPVIVGPTTGEP